MTEYYFVKLKATEHVILVEKNGAHDALLVRLDSNNRADLLFVDKEDLTTVTRTEVPHKSESTEPPYYWVPGEPD